ncbi:MAG: hypothetical protein ACJASQ_001200 [Crocinitomicaceae bacterium]|jgi:hypothetical protein
MVKKIEFHVGELTRIYSDFQSFLDESLVVVTNKNELKEYLDYVKGQNDYFNDYINNLNTENSTHLYGLVGGICRFFSEFNWFEDYVFYTKAQGFKIKLTEEAHFIYNYFQKVKLKK